MNLKKMTLGALEKKHKQLNNKLLKIYKWYNEAVNEINKKAYIYEILKADIAEIEEEYKVITQKFVRDCERINKQIEEIETQIKETILVNIETLKR